MWAQNSKSNWIVQVDRNTKFFQTVVKQRRARSRILHLKMDDGEKTEDNKVIENTSVEHFRNHFTEVDTKPFYILLKELESLPIPKLNQHQQCSLDRPITDG